MIRTRIFLNSREVDLIDDISIPLTYAIADIRNPESRNTSFSKSIALPGTAINNVLFGDLFDISVDVNTSGSVNSVVPINPNKKANVLILFEDSIIFTGYLQLVSITRSEGDYKHEFECVVYGKLKDLFLNIGEKLLSQVDLSEFNHALTYSNQKNSWATSIKKNGADVAFQLGQGYVYPMIDYGRNNDVNYKVIDFSPAVYVKSITDKIINSAGFNVVSNFFNSSFYKSLVIPFSGGELSLSSSQVNQRTHKASSTSDSYIYSSGFTIPFPGSPIPYQDDSTGTNHDAGGIYNTSTYIMTAPKNGSYKINAALNVSLTHFPASSPASVQFGYQIGSFVLVRKSGLSYTVIGSVVLYAVALNSSISASCFNIVCGATVSSGNTSGSFTGTLTNTFSFLSGDEVYVAFLPTFTGTQSLYNGQPNVAAGGSAYTRVNILSSSFFESILANTEIQEGDTVDMSNVLPSVIKQKDFLSSIFKMFNLYIEQDKQVSNTLYIEARDDFYATSGTTRDWSKKLDMTKDLEILPMGELNARTYMWQYKSDEDYYNSFYQNKWKENYGRKRLDIDNDFLSNENLNEVIFSATPLADRNGADRIMPRIFQADSTGFISPKAGNIRILFYGGVKTTSFPWNYIATSGTTTEQTYAYAGHLDDPTFPTVDLSFDSPKEVYYTATAYTDNNLYNAYWQKFINEITGPNSKIIIGWFHVSSLDIELLNFRDTFYFEGDEFRLNMIYDYDGTTSDLVKCEFIKVQNGIPFISTTAQTNGSKSQTFGAFGTLLPQAAQRMAQNNNGGNYSGSLSRGTNNVIDPSAVGAMVIGNDNYIGAMCRNISFLNTSGCTTEGNTEGMVAINCRDQHYNSFLNGMTVIDGTINGYRKLSFKRASYKSGSDDFGKLFIMNISADSTFDLPDGFTILNGWSCEIKNVNAGAHTITVDLVDASVFEDGVSVTSVLSAYDSACFTYRSGIWYITSK